MKREQFLKRAESLLTRRRDELRRSVNDELNQLGSDDAFSVRDQIDEAVDDDYRLLTSNLAEHESRELERIEYALQRLESGEYGVCEDCGCPIPVARLQAVPYAAKCVKCQERAERQPIVARFKSIWDEPTESETASGQGDMLLRTAG